MKTLTLLAAVTLSVTLLTVSSCQTLDTRTQKLRLEMTKEQVTKELGKHFKAVGGREGSDGRKVEVIKYDDDKNGELFLYFRDGKLVQWGDTAVLEKMPN